MNPLVILLLILIAVALLTLGLYFIGTYASKPSDSSGSDMQPIAQANISCLYGGCDGY